MGRARNGSVEQGARWRGRALARAALVVPLVLSLAVCDRDSRLSTGPPPDDDVDDPGDGPAPPFSHIVGSFSLTVLLTFTDLSSGDRRTEICPGSVAVAELDGSEFAGSFTIEPSAECARGDSGAISGRVRELGELEFDLRVEGRERNQLPNLTGCDYAGEPGRFGGAVNAKRFVATSTAAVFCTTPEGPIHSFELRIRIDGEREA